MDLEELKKQSNLIRGQSLPGKRVYWPESFRDDAVKLMSSGHSANTVASITHIAVSTLYTWIKRKRVKSADQFKQLKIVESQVSNLSLTWQAGLSIEGLSFTQVKELLSEGLL